MHAINASWCIVKGKKRGVSREGKHKQGIKQCRGCVRGMRHLSHEDALLAHGVPPAMVPLLLKPGYPRELGSSPLPAGLHFQFGPRPRAPEGSDLMHPNRSGGEPCEGTEARMLPLWEPTQAYLVPRPHTLFLKSIGLRLRHITLLLALAPQVVTPKQPHHRNVSLLPCLSCPETFRWVSSAGGV